MDDFASDRKVFLFLFFQCFFYLFTSVDVCEAAKNNAIIAFRRREGGEMLDGCFRYFIGESLSIPFGGRFENKPPAPRPNPYCNSFLVNLQILDRDFHLEI